MEGWEKAQVSSGAPEVSMLSSPGASAVPLAVNSGGKSHHTRANEKLEPPPMVDSGRKLTRNLKRRFDEMHHLQRVF